MAWEVWAEWVAWEEWEECIDRALYIFYFLQYKASGLNNISSLFFIIFKCSIQISIANRSNQHSLNTNTRKVWVAGHTERYF